MQTNQRNSSIEILKFISIVMIVLSHAMPYTMGEITYPNYMMDLGLSTLDIQRLIIVFFRYLGRFADTVFIISSSSFLLEKNQVKGEKVFRLISDTVFISALFCIVFLVAGYDISLKEVIKSFFPVSLTSYWFISCYLVFYIIHPMFNTVMEKTNQKSLLSIVIVLFLVYSIANTFHSDMLYYTRLIGFIVIYFIIGYIKKYMTKMSQNKPLNIVMLLFGLLGMTAMFVVTGVAGVKYGLLVNQMLRWCIFVNPFIIIGAVGMFNLGKNKTFYSKPINFLSSLSLLVYIIHENKFVLLRLKPQIYEYIYNTFSYQKELLWVVVYAVSILIISIIIGSIYKILVQKSIYKLSDKIFTVFKKLTDKCLGTLMKIK